MGMGGNEAVKRNRIIRNTSILGIVANLLIAGIKVVLGLLTSSVAIVSEGVNNAGDVLTSVLTMVGTKLAAKHPDAKHPFGYGRLEYLTALVIAVIILVSGVEMLIESVKLVFRPEPLEVSYLALGIVAGSAVLKFALGLYTIAMGRKANSSALEAVGIDCRNDAFGSAITIVACVVFLVTGVSIDAYAGIVISALIVKSGVGVLKGTIAELLGRPGEAELARRLYRRIRETKGIENAADMMLHNYGPDAWSGSVNVEMDHDLSVGEAYGILHALQLAIMHEEKVTMVFGVYAVDRDHEESKAVRNAVLEFVKRREYVKSFHAIYLEPGTGRIYCDLIVDYALRDWEPLRSEFLDYMKNAFPENEVVLTIETEFV